MRRKDRKIDEDVAWRIVDKAEYAVMSMVDYEGHPYGVPISPARIGEMLYIHGARQGKKMGCLHAHKEVSLCFVGDVRVPSPISDAQILEHRVYNKLAALMSSKFTTEYESVIISAEASLVSDEMEKRQALRAISQRYTPENMAYADEAIDLSLIRTAIFRLKVRSITGKHKILAENMR